MRIAYLSADYGVPVLGGKGGSVHIKELVNAFDALGHSVHVVCAPRGTGHDELRAALTEFPLPLGAELCTMRMFDIGWTRLRDIADALGQLVRRKHETAGFDFIYERYSLWSRAGVRAARRLGIPAVIEVNAPLLLEQSRYRKLVNVDVAAAIEAEVFVESDVLIAVSESVRDYLIAKGALPSRVHVIPNGANVARFHPRVEPARLELLENDLVIGFTGGLAPWHGLPDLVEAFRLTLLACPQARLIIVGDGPMRATIEGLAAAAGVADRVMITGWRPHSEIPALLRRFDIAVAPYPEIDGFYFSPLKLFEYLAAGRPVVASAIGQITDVIEDGVNGLLVAPGRPDRLAERLVRLLKDAPLRARLGRAARATAEERSWLANARRVLELVRQAQRARALDATREDRVVAQ
jgi:glycosyltransferase involved in cell wall biosynthesis